MPDSNLQQASSSAEPQDRHQQILDAAARMFFERGYRETRLSDIADAIDIKAASIYHHFKNKQELLATLIVQMMDELIDAASASIMMATAPEDQLDSMVRSYVYVVGSRPTQGMIGDRELHNLEDITRAIVISKRDQYEKLLQGILDYGRTTGVFTQADTQFTTFAILGMCNHIGLWYQPSGRLQLDQIADLASDAALRLAGTDSAALNG